MVPAFFDRPVVSLLTFFFFFLTTWFPRRYRKEYLRESWAFNGVISH